MDQKALPNTNAARLSRGPGGHVTRTDEYGKGKFRENASRTEMMRNQRFQIRHDKRAEKCGTQAKWAQMQNHSGSNMQKGDERRAADAATNETHNRRETAIRDDAARDSNHHDSGLVEC